MVFFQIPRPPRLLPIMSFVVDAPLQIVRLSEVSYISCEPPFSIFLWKLWKQFFREPLDIFVKISWSWRELVTKISWFIKYRIFCCVTEPYHWMSDASRNKWLSELESNSQTLFIYSTAVKMSTAHTVLYTTKGFLN